MTGCPEGERGREGEAGGQGCCQQGGCPAPPPARPPSWRARGASVPMLRLWLVVNFHQKLMKF